MISEADAAQSGSAGELEVPAMAFSLLVEFDQVSRRIIRAGAGIDISAPLLAPSEKIGRLHIHLDKPMPCRFDFLAKLLEGFGFATETTTDTEFRALIRNSEQT